MKIYIAGFYAGGFMPSLMKDPGGYRGKLSKKWFDESTPILESFHYIGKGEKYTNAIYSDKRKIFLDSGAFSMFTQGIEVDLKAYAEFVKKHKKIIEVSSNLDHIGQGTEQKTWDNQRKLEDYGAVIQPVHHARDKDEWLIKYIEAGYDYIFLGGMVPESTTYLRQWLDRIWENILTDKNGKPIVKVHGFGLTTAELMLRYPWYSVDSTSWIMASSTGSVYIPINGRLKTISYSDQSSSVKKRGRHFSTISKQERKIIRKWFKKYKFKEKNLQGRQYGRSLWNIMMFRYIQDNTNWPTKFINTHRGLFDGQGF